MSETPVWWTLSECRSTYASGTSASTWQKYVHHFVTHRLQAAQSRVSTVSAALEAARAEVSDLSAVLDAERRQAAEASRVAARAEEQMHAAASSASALRDQLKQVGCGSWMGGADSLRAASAMMSVRLSLPHSFIEGICTLPSLDAGPEVS